MTTSPTEHGKNQRGFLPRLPLLFTLVFLGMALLPSIRMNAGLVLATCVLCSGLLIWQFLLWKRAAHTGRQFHVEFVPVRSHYVQAMVQLSVYVYWGWYWPEVYKHAPLILSQILFLYVFGALLAWSRGRTWQLGFGVLPIIFSTNLFMWFTDDWFIFQYLMVATGALGKEFIQWNRDGRRIHIFNPSAFGLFLFSIALVLTNTSQYTWGWEIATTLGRPPYIYIEIFLAGLVVQGFFGVTLMTFSAALTLWILNLAYTQTTGVYFFVDTNIPIAVFLGLHLLMTDPATTPRANVGKFIFGSLYGLGVWVCYAILREFNLPEYYDKLLIVPFLNLSVQIIDRLAAWNFIGALSIWENAFGLKKLNLIHMACWALLFATMLGTDFIEAPHPGTRIAFWQKAAEEGRPHAVENLITKLSLLSYSGNAEACNELGEIYSSGKLIPRDSAAAAKFFARARELASSPNGMSATPTAQSWTPELMAKMQSLLTHAGKDIDVNPILSAQLGLNRGNQPWPSRQIAGAIQTNPAYLHSFSVSRDESQPDLLVSLRTPTQLYIFRSNRDGVVVEGAAIITDERTGQSTVLGSQEAQIRLNQEFAFWTRMADRLLAAIPRGESM